MPRRNPPPPITGDGRISLRGSLLPVRYSLASAPVRTGVNSDFKAVKGAIEVDPDLARAAFKAGVVTLHTDDGLTVRVQVVAHSEGSRTAFVESIR